MARHRLTSFLIILALAMPIMDLPVLVDSAQAASKKRPRPQPQRCFTLAKKIGASRVWWGRHVGYRDVDPVFEWGPKREVFNDIACFRSRKDCENWLYWMRTDFPHSTYYKPCRRGL